MNILALNGTSNPEVCSALNSVGRSRVKTNLEQYVPTVNRKNSAVNNSDFYHLEVPRATNINFLLTISMYHHVKKCSENQ